ncbi:putative trehalase [Acorus gramineus]|uniref:Trehalase n=1 Tax=Acorus gramineus TaxID=55184 RepID=A0AAV9A2L4_ACOGR|nr:putative trehalase [Acorus gramineus]
MVRWRAEISNSEVKREGQDIYILCYDNDMDVKRTAKRFEKPPHTSRQKADARIPRALDGQNKDKLHVYKVPPPPLILSATIMAYYYYQALKPHTLYCLLLFSSLLPCFIPYNNTKPSTPLIAFLESLQSTALQTLGPKDFDPKLYVDLPLKHDLPVVESAFAKLPRSANGTVPVEDLDLFIERYLGRAGTDMVLHEPSDFVADPDGFLPKVENSKVRTWALEVHSLWKNLSREVADAVRERPGLHTLLPLPGPLVVPGSRFREVYYWDSYWVIRGLLASKMYDSAKAIVNNLISLIDVYGFVLNGSRAYYSNRSQPPLLSAMVFEIFSRTGDLDFIKKCLPSLLKEHHFWNSGIHKLTFQDSQGKKHSLSRYYAMWNKPRPESATMDKESASKLQTISAKESFYRELASAAESGWDFSSRWMRDSSDLTTLVTTSVVPVDLNAYILKMELDIAFFAQITGDHSTADKFSVASQARRAAMDSIFWNNKMNQWFDYWLTDNSICEEVHMWESNNQNKKMFASNFIPVWIKPYSTDGGIVKKVMKSLQRSGLLYPAGIATSLSKTGQQWDFPNGWAPLIHMIVEGLVKSGTKEGRSMGEDIAVRWIRTNYAAYKKTGAMHEKYDVEACGESGGGGEYVPQDLAGQME